ncbi:MAG: TlpA family protein disulfide reductase [Ignavibacteriales bacterium]|nr:TlpA family protein disulfide reductase [Ignavibacteriales bacterium]
MKLLLSLFFFVTLLSGQDYRTLAVETIGGEEISIEELTARGPVLINFWALWCEPCKIEMKQLQSLFEKYRERHFSIVAVNQDNQKSVAKVASYVSSQQFTFYVALDPGGEIAQQFNLQNIPLSILLDRNGKVAYKALGYKPGDEKKLEEAILETLTVENVQ